jgi:hypothetical protein
MSQIKPIRCRIAACREALDDGKEWSFYLINDSDAPLDSAVLNQVGYEWGDWGSSEAADIHIAGLAAGGHALIWRDDGSGAELRMDLSLLVRVGDREVRLLFEFPKLYLKSNLPVIVGLGKPGWQEVAEG